MWSEADWGSHGGSFTAGGAEVYDGSGIVTTAAVAVSAPPLYLAILCVRLTRARRSQ